MSISPRPARMARLLTVGLMGGLTFLAGEREPSREPALQPEAGTRAMAEAWDLTQRAQSLAEARRPTEALVGLQRAYDLSRDPSLLLEVARLEREVGSPARAAHALEVFLDHGRSSGAEQAHQLATRQLQELTVQTARVNVQTNVQGAEAELEAERGVASSHGFVVSLLLDAGERRISLSKAGYEAQTVTLSLEPGEVRTLRVDLEKAARGRSYATSQKPRWALWDRPRSPRG